MLEPLLPVLLGQDLNAYGVAVSMHEAFGLCSLALGRYRCGICSTSSIVSCEVVPALSSGRVALDALGRIADRYRERELLLVPCNDPYLAFVEEHRETLAERYRFVIPPRELYETVCDKYAFYSLLDRYGIPYPNTELFEPDTSPTIAPPWVLKPSDSVDYYSHPFDGMRKVYFPKSLPEAQTIARTIRSSGYRGKLLLQEFIVRDRAFVLTVMAERERGVRVASLAEVVVEECAPGARGNYCALLVRPLNDFAKRLIAFCNAVGYHGIANFDILEREGRLYCLEMNPRQGRSSDYLRGAGHSVGAFLQAVARGEPYPVRMRSTPIYWHAVPHRTVRALASPRLVEECDARVREGFDFSPFRYDADYRFHPLRRAYVHIHAHRRGKALYRYATTL